MLQLIGTVDDWYCIPTPGSCKLRPTLIRGESCLHLGQKQKQERRFRWKVTDQIAALCFQDLESVSGQAVFRSIGRMIRGIYLLSEGMVVLGAGLINL